MTLWDRFLTMRTFGPPLRRLMRARGKLVAQLGYMLLHLALASATFAIAVLLWHSQVAHFAFVVTFTRIGGRTTLWTGRPGPGGGHSCSKSSALVWPVAARLRRPHSPSNRVDAAAALARGALATRRRKAWRLQLAAFLPALLDKDK